MFEICRGTRFFFLREKGGKDMTKACKLLPAGPGKNTTLERGKLIPGFQPPIPPPFFPLSLSLSAIAKDEKESERRLRHVGESYTPSHSQGNKSQNRMHLLILRNEQTLQLWMDACVSVYARVRACVCVFRKYCGGEGEGKRRA